MPRFGAALRHNRIFFKTSRPRICYSPKARIHIILIDGTLSRLTPGHETNVGLMYKMLRNDRALRERVNIYYQPGLQWRDWANVHHLAIGRGINAHIKGAYGWLAVRYRTGDQIYLVGFSRGAYAVRSLSGWIDRYGLLRAHHTTQRAIDRHFRLYRRNLTGTHMSQYIAQRCHPQTPIAFLGVWDTVKAMGLRFAVLDRIFGIDHRFHNPHLAGGVERALHILARDERRHAYRPVMWQSDPASTAQMRQIWMRGTHGDIGGHIYSARAARPLSNVALSVMMLSAGAAGMPLPSFWQVRVTTDYFAPSVGAWHGVAKLFLWRGARRVGQDPSEEHIETTEFKSVF